MTDPNYLIIPGDTQSRVLLHVPHSSREIPALVRPQLLLDDTELNQELDEMTDSATDYLAMQSAKNATSKPWLFVNLLSRLVIDPERFPDERESMNEVGMGAVYTKTSAGKVLRLPSPTEEEALLKSYFHPYAAALSHLVGERLHANGAVTIVDVHSYRPIAHLNGINHYQQRPALCIGTDQFHTPEMLITGLKQAFQGIGSIVENEPYAGTYVPLDYYEKDCAVSSVMTEIRADTFLNPDLTFNAGCEKVISALSRFINQI